MSNRDSDLIYIDIDSVVRSRLPRYSRFIPRWLTRGLERIICQDKLNEMLRVNHGKRNASFCRGVIDYLGVTYSVKNASNLPLNPRAIFVCNHPLGGLDGMILIDMLKRHYGMEPRFIVNDLLMAIKPLSGVFLPINKHGKQSRKSSSDIEEALASEAPIIIFPAGLVSRKRDNGQIADLEWHKMFVNKAVTTQRNVIPLHFSGHNSKFFYNFAKLRSRLGIPFNIEMVRLPAEMFRCEGSNFTVSVGKVIEWQSLSGGRNADKEALSIREAAYRLNSETT